MVITSKQYVPHVGVYKSFIPHIGGTFYYSDLKYLLIEYFPHTTICTTESFFGPFQIQEMQFRKCQVILYVSKTGVLCSS